MKIQIIATIYLGIAAGLYGVSSAAQNDTNQTGNEYHNLRHQLMWDQVEMVEESSDPSQTDTLDDLIRQLRSLEIPEKLLSQEPNEPTPSQTEQAIAPLPSEEMQTDEGVKKPMPEDDLVTRIEKVDKVVNPLQLADVLYRQGYFKLAFKNYYTVGEQLNEGNVVDRQWILFQKANCLRNSDPDEAIELYSELIESFPNSKWADIANSRIKMIKWIQANQNESLPENKLNDTNNE